MSMALDISRNTPILAAYDRRQVVALLRDGTPQQLRADLHSGRFEGQLARHEAAYLDELLLAWEQRALGPMSLRDAMLVDGERGPQVYNLICSALTKARAPVPAELAPFLTAAPSDLRTLPPALAADPHLAHLAQLAERDGLVLAWLTRPDQFPTPAELTALIPEPPKSPRDERTLFEPPSGRRRQIAAGLAGLGVTILALPLLIGRIPDSPARWPLALLTIALMIGIRAGPAGFLGAACIWLVANLPGFRHGLSLQQLWPAPLLLTLGLYLLSIDRRVQLMWRWIRRRYLR
jgi:hypothetical protein